MQSNGTIYSPIFTTTVIKDSLEEKVLMYCINPRTREENCSYLKLSKNHVMSNIILPLVDNKKLLLTKPDKPKSSLQKYYTNNK